MESILRFLGFSLLGAAILVAVITLGSAWLVGDAARSIFGGSLFPDSTVTTVVNGQAIVESIRSANKQILVEHYNVVDIDYSEAPAGWLGLLPIQQNFVLLLKGRVPAGFDLETLPEGLFGSARMGDGCSWCYHHRSSSPRISHSILRTAAY
ncbi:MAG: hypothetical protein R2867_16355 [Caldilineaceae bacterium]